ncbi:MAG: dTDP-4-dehydrorhamnose reductase [Deltaproteobacteria bacterium]|nr:dTDP-4-dehydrorhamnose reductase [Deltaproteobacteria bacterium]
MKILLFGGAGQLGFEIQKRAFDLDFEVVSPVLSEVDITNEHQVTFLSQKVRADLVINCAAYTAVDKAETDQEEAYKINRDGAAVVARAAREVGSRMIHISTDYVFDGTASAPISESHPTNPINVYGASKLAGEIEVQNVLGNRALVVRTSSLHGQRGENFVHTMVKLFTEREVVKVVNDQWMSATWAGWLAEAVLDLGRTDCHGLVHASCAGALTWYDFAAAILQQVQEKNEAARRCKLEPTTAQAFARPARRPQYSVFDCTRLTTLLGRKPISWQDGLRSHLREIGY